MDGDSIPAAPDRHATDRRAAPYFDAVLRPHRSLSHRHFVILMGIIVGFNLVWGLLFVSAGAWPVVGFLSVAVGLIYWAFAANYRSGRAFETLRLGERVLEVRKVDPRGASRAWFLEPYCLRVDMDNPPEHESQLVLTSFGQKLVVGAFLTPAERLQVAEALKAALMRRQAALATG